MLPLVLIMLVGSMQTTYFSLSNAMLLHAAPEHMRGRVISLLSLDRAMTTMGAAIAGFLAEWMGAQPSQAIFGVIVAAGAILVFGLNRPFRSVTMDRDPQPLAADVTTAAGLAAPPNGAAPSPPDHPFGPFHCARTLRHRCARVDPRRPDRRGAIA